LQICGLRTASEPPMPRSGQSGKLEPSNQHLYNQTNPFE